MGKHLKIDQTGQKGFGKQGPKMVSLKGIHRKSVGGQTYVYHRPTGTRLPDLPNNHPDFISAVRNAAKQSKVKSRAPKRRTDIEALDIPIESAKMRQPDMVAHTLIMCARFVLSAKPKSLLLYHSGDLSADGAYEQSSRDKAQYILLAASFDLLSLRQERVTAGWTYYYATRTDHSIKGCPQHVLYGDITPDEYRALVAVNERQASQATSRAIRDELGISDTAASEMRNSMIHRGWMNNSRPPELTELGLELLT